MGAQGRTVCASARCGEGVLRGIRRRPVRPPKTGPHLAHLAVSRLRHHPGRVAVLAAGVAVGGGGGAGGEDAKGLARAVKGGSRGSGGRRVHSARQQQRATPVALSPCSLLSVQPSGNACWPGKAQPHRHAPVPRCRHRARAVGKGALRLVRLLCCRSRLGLLLFLLLMLCPGRRLGGFGRSAPKKGLAAAELVWQEPALRC